MRLMENNLGSTIPLKCLQVLLLMNVCIDFVFAFQECWYVFQQSDHIISEHYIWQKSSLQAVRHYRVQSEQLRLHDLTSALLFVMADEHISPYIQSSILLRGKPAVYNSQQTSDRNLLSLPNRTNASRSSTDDGTYPLGQFNSPPCHWRSALLVP